MFFLKFILFLFLFFIVYLVLVGFRLYWKFRQLKRTFESQQTKSEHYRKHRQSDGNVIIDQRPPKQKKTKIIDDDEGEYVDFEEV